MSEAELTPVVPLMRPVAEEVVNTVTHGVGLALSIVGSVALLVCVSANGDVWRITGCAIYAASLIAVYAFSTLSHAVSRPEPKRMFRVLDQAFIYLLIAGTYTPFAMAYLRTPGWWLFFGVMWSCAFCGFFSKILFSHRIDSVLIWLYVLMGWLPSLAVKPMLELIPTSGLWWLLAGGLCYTGGTFFLLNDHRNYYYHAYWHLFVIAGSLCQFTPILLYVTQPA